MGRERGGERGEGGRGREREREGERGEGRGERERRGEGCTKQHRIFQLASI